MSDFDQQLYQEVVDMIEQDARIVVAGLEVTGHGGMVNISGTVESYEARQVAEEDAWTVPGVNFVKNNLRVRTGEENSIDSETENNIREAIGSDVDLQKEDIQVTIDEGIITLEGTVDSVWKRERVQNILWGARGITDFVLRIAVVPEMRMEDEAIAHSILRNLDRERSVDINTLIVTVERGVVTLSGIASSFESRSAAYEATLRTPGVAEVNDQIEVQTSF